MQKAYILTECGQHIGYGHLMRCMPLYDELVLSGFDVQFLLNGDVNETLMKGAGRDYHYEIMNWLTISYAFLQHSICLVDSYLADVSQYQAIAAAAQTLIVIDDNDRLPYQHAVVVNPSLFGDTLGYTRDATCHYLLGKRYIILRDAFRHRYEKKIESQIHTCTVIMGGTDVLQLTPIIVTTLCQQFPSWKVNVITGQPFAAPSAQVTFLSNQTAMQMVDCFLQSDVVISAGGQTCNELVQLKTPSVLLTVADNQSNNVKAMTEGGFALSLLATEVERDLVPTLQQMTYDVRYAMYKKMCPLDFSNGARQIIKDSIASSGR